MWRMSDMKMPGERGDEVTRKRSLLGRLLGVKRRPGKRLPVGLTKWGWVLVVLVVGGVGSAGFAEYSMQPAFCQSCHIMEPYYQAWHSSTHKNVPCVDCHFEPGLKNTMYGKFQASSQAVKYLTHTYGSKPHAEIRDVSCMREGCHVKRLLEGKVNWKIKTQQGNEITIRFDHAPHLQQERRGKQLRCVSCHSQIVQGQHIVVTVDTCFLCHFKGLKHGRDDQTIGGCRGCHEAPKGEIRLATGMFNHADYLGRGVLCENCHADTVKGDGAVPRQVCWTCHNQPAQIARYGETQFVHNAHVTEHKVECSSCHVQIEHNLTANAPVVNKRADGMHVLADSGTCGLCHERTHGGPLDMYRGVGGRGVPEMPSPMSRAHVNCIACHQQGKEQGQVAQVVGQTFVATQERCTYCHANKYDGKLAEWKQVVSDNLDNAEAAYREAQTALQTGTARGGLSAMEQLKAQRLLDDADHNIRLVKLGHGVHNVTYATALLNQAAENCRQVKKVAGVGGGGT